MGSDRASDDIGVGTNGHLLGVDAYSAVDKPPSRDQFPAPGHNPSLFDHQGPPGSAGNSL
jgi:hypothetical protein